MEKVSVIVPVYNAEAVVERCVYSICRQTYQNLEIILIDDGSKDNSYELCRKMMESDERIILRKQPNKGVSAARNAGIQIAAGTYVKFVDSDDYLEEACIEKEVSCVERTGSKMVISGYFRVSGQQRTEKSTALEETCYEVKQSGDILLALYENMFLQIPWNKLFLREEIRHSFREDYSLGEDLLFNLQYLSKIDQFSLLPQSGYCFSYSQQNSLRTKYREQDLINSYQNYNALKQFFSKITEDLNSLAILDYIYAENTKQIFMNLRNEYKSPVKAVNQIRRQFGQPLFQGTRREAMRKKNNRLIRFCCLKRHPFLLWCVLSLMKWKRENRR